VDRNHVRVFAAGGWTYAKAGGALAAALREGGGNDTPARELARAVRDVGQVYVPSLIPNLVFRADRYLRGGDQLPFEEAGYAAVRFTEPVEDFRHQHQDVRTVEGIRYGDLPDFVDYNYAAGVTRLNTAVLAELARAPAPPAGARIDATRLESDTTLLWDRGMDQGIAGYRIVWRDTLAPYWEHHLDVPPGAAQATVPVSKDDVEFGIEAFDAAGHVSPAAFPAAKERP
jgi:hypothetical protein